MQKSLFFCFQFFYLKGNKRQWIHPNLFFLVSVQPLNCKHNFVPQHKQMWLGSTSVVKWSRAPVIGAGDPRFKSSSRSYLTTWKNISLILKKVIYATWSSVQAQVHKKRGSEHSLQSLQNSSLFQWTFWTLTSSWSARVDQKKVQGSRNPYSFLFWIAIKGVIR